LGFIEDGICKAGLHLAPSGLVGRVQAMAGTFFNRRVSMIGDPTLNVRCRNARLPRHRLGEEGDLEKDAKPFCKGLAKLQAMHLTLEKEAMIGSKR
jgi:hypothetical protein